MKGDIGYFTLELEGSFKELKNAYTGFADDTFFVNQPPIQNPVYKILLRDIVLNFLSGDFAEMLRGFINSGQVSLGPRPLE